MLQIAPHSDHAHLLCVHIPRHPQLAVTCPFSRRPRWSSISYSIHCDFVGHGIVTKLLSAAVTVPSSEGTSVDAADHLPATPCSPTLWDSDSAAHSIVLSVGSHLTIQWSIQLVLIRRHVSHRHCGTVETPHIRWCSHWEVT